jgi:hypothetical protein
MMLVNVQRVTDVQNQGVIVVPFFFYAGFGSFFKHVVRLMKY